MYDAFINTIMTVVIKTIQKRQMIQKSMRYLSASYGYVSRYLLKILYHAFPSFMLDALFYFNVHHHFTCKQRTLTYFENNTSKNGIKILKEKRVQG